MVVQLSSVGLCLRLVRSTWGSARKPAAWHRPSSAGRTTGMARRTNKPVTQAASQTRKLRRLTLVISCNPPRRTCLDFHRPCCLFAAYFGMPRLTSVWFWEQLGISPNDPLPDLVDSTSGRDLPKESESGRRWCRAQAESGLALLRAQRS